MYCELLAVIPDPLAIYENFEWLVFRKLLFSTILCTIDFLFFVQEIHFPCTPPISNDLGQKRLVSSDNYFQTKMKAVVQRVLSGSVRVEGEVVASIGKGFVALIGIHRCSFLWRPFCEDGFC